MRKSPIECRAGGRTGREEGAQESGEAGTDVRDRDKGIEESARKEIGCRRNKDAMVDAREHKDNYGKKTHPWDNYGGTGVNKSTERRFTWYGRVIWSDEEHLQKTW